MAGQIIHCGLDTAAVWERVRGRLAVFLDTNCWIGMADEVDEATCRVRDRLRDLIASGRAFCPISWGLLEELFLQSGESLDATSGLMEELSLNAVYLNREELYRWELDRAIRRVTDAVFDTSLSGLYAPPMAFVGSYPCLRLPSGNELPPEAAATAEAHMKRGLSRVGVARLAREMSGTAQNRTSPAYSKAARYAKETLKREQDEVVSGGGG